VFYDELQRLYKELIILYEDNNLPTKERYIVIDKVEQSEKNY
jgi:hypothetical protein